LDSVARSAGLLAGVPISAVSLVTPLLVAYSLGGMGTIDLSSLSGIGYAIGTAVMKSITIYSKFVERIPGVRYAACLNSFARMDTAADRAYAEEAWVQKATGYNPGLFANLASSFKRAWNNLGETSNYATTDLHDGAPVRIKDTFDDECKRVETQMRDMYGKVQTFTMDAIANTKSVVELIFSTAHLTVVGWFSSVYGYVASLLPSSTLWILDALASPFVFGNQMVTYFGSLFAGATGLTWLAMSLFTVGATALIFYFFIWPYVKNSWHRGWLGKIFKPVLRFMTGGYSPWSDPTNRRAFQANMRAFLKQPLEALQKLAVSTTPIELTDLNLLLSTVEHAIAAADAADRRELEGMKRNLQRRIRASETQVYRPLPSAR
jgi:hypothetical protein